MIRENKGITLIALTITIIILIILASVATYSGISTIKSSKLNKFKQELEIMQAQVQVLYEKYKEEETIDVGKEITGSGKEEQAENAFNGAEETNTSGYRLFDAEEIEKLGIDGIEREYLLDIMNRKVISLEPFEQDGVAYFTLDQISEKNTIDEGIARDSVNFSVSTTEASNGWEITISNIEYSKYVGKGKILYQKVGNDNWTTVVDDFKGNEYTFSVSSEGEYNIKIIDAAGIEKTTENPITIGALGNYLLDGTTYYDTLQEAVDAASNGSTIRVMRDVTEEEGTDIDKDIILDTNGKNITETTYAIVIESNAKVVFNGNGTIKKEANSGNLIHVMTESMIEINGTTIIASPGSNLGSINNSGTVVINSGEVLTMNGGIAIENHKNLKINSGTIGRIRSWENSNIEIIGGTIEQLSCLHEGTEINISIGDASKEINTATPEINDLGEIFGEIIFNNGIIKSENSGDFNELQIRAGYKTQVTYNSSTGLYECILVPQ